MVKVLNMKKNSSISDKIHDLKERIKTGELDYVLDQVKHLLKTDGVTNDEAILLKSLRQQAYDKKRKGTVVGKHTDRPKVKSSLSVQPQAAPKLAEVEHVPNRLPFNVERLFTLDGLVSSALLQKIPTVIIFSASALLSMSLIYIQSVPLYESIGFVSPELCAAGALLMISGFAVMHSMTRSKLALFLCLYASAYEVSLIVQGTLKNEITSSERVVQENPRVIFLKEQVSKSLESYKINKAAYEDSTSNVFHNTWYQKKQLEPSWSAYAANQKALDLALTPQKDANQSGPLKIFYRLGLVFLCMISLHNITKFFRKKE